MRDEKGALESLTKSVQLDPTNLPAHLRLSDLYQRLKMHSDRNRLLDQMTQRFPDNKEVLIQAARGCLERSACKKGLQYLEQVRQRDLLDPVVPSLMVAGLLQQARQQFQQQRPEPARASLERARELLVERPDDLERSRWTFLTRQGLLEQDLGDPQRAEALLAEARAASPCPDAFLLYAHMQLRVTTHRKRGQPTPFSQELNRPGPMPARAVHGALLLRIFQHVIGDESPYGYHIEANLIRTYLRAALGEPFTREEARKLVEQAEHIELFAGEAKQFVRAILKQDANDPLFRLLDFVLAGNHEFGNPETSRHTLQSIIQEAERRGDHATIQRAERMLESIQRGPLAPLPPEDDSFADEPEEDEDLPEDAEPSPIDAAMFDELARRIAAMTESEFNKFRKSEAKRLPPGMFDMMMNAIRGSKPLPPPPPAATPLPPVPPKPDPNQMNLF
jgi:tetratricopeptide (TPR) repeat protein